MNSKELFKILIKAYYENRFEETVNGLLDENADNKQYIANTISALCGVEVTYTNNFANELKKAILNYDCTKKIVLKINDCCMDCTDSNGKTQCQNSCPFEAILIDEEKHSTVIDNSKCTDCGFCIEACPNNNYIDKIQYFPLINSL